jgi:hypothetical protein
MRRGRRRQSVRAWRKEGNGRWKEALPSSIEVGIKGKRG